MKLLSIWIWKLYGPVLMLPTIADPDSVCASRGVAVSEHVHPDGSDPVLMVCVLSTAYTRATWQ